MGISVEEIRNSNKKFYYGCYFSKSKRERGFWLFFSIIMVTAFQLIAYYITYRLIKQCYINQARYIDLGTQEIYDWVNSQMGFFPKEIVIILMTGGVIILYTIILYCSDVINIYKRKRNCIIGVMVIFFIEIIGIMFFNREILSNNISVLFIMGLLYFLKIIFELLNAGIIFPIEMKAPAAKICINIINKFINRMVDKALKKA